MYRARLWFRRGLLYRRVLSRRYSVALGEVFAPVMRVEEVRCWSAQNQIGERVLVLFSDAVDSLAGMLPARLNYLILSQFVLKGSLVRVSRWVFEVIHGRPLILNFDLQVLADKMDDLGFGVCGGAIAGSVNLCSKDGSFEVILCDEEVLLPLYLHVVGLQKVFVQDRGERYTLDLAAGGKRWFGFMAESLNGLIASQGSEDDEGEETFLGCDNADVVGL